VSKSASGTISGKVIGADTSVTNGVEILLDSPDVIYEKDIKMGQGNSWGDTITIGGEVELTITAGTFSGDIYGAGQYCNISNGVQVKISGGSFSGEVYGGHQGGDSIKGGVELTIDGGLFNNAVYGGASGRRGTSANIKGGIQVTINEGTFLNNVYGGGYYGSSYDAADDKVISMLITGGTFGSEDSASKIYATGYTYCARGDVELVITGGTFTNCSVISAGNASSASGFVEGGTSITIKNGVLNGYTGTLDGGYLISYSTGVRSLIISGGTNDLSGATFINFDKIQVTEGGSLTLNSGGLSSVSLDLDNGTLVLGNTAAAYKGITVQNGGALTVGTVASDGGSALRATRAASGTSTQLTLGGDGLTVDSGSTLTLTLNASSVDELVANGAVVSSEGNISLESGSTLVLNNAGSITSAGDEKISVTLMTTDGTASVGSVTLTDNVLKALYDTEVKADGQSVVLVGTRIDENVFTSADSDSSDQGTQSASPLSANAGAGAELLWNGRFSALASGSVLADVFATELDLMDAGDTTTLNKSLAAVAGSTINSVGTAQRDALRDQLGTIRDRALAVSTDGSQLGHHFWIEGNGGYNHVRTQSDKGGYKLSTWGGTVGADLEATKDLTLGVAFTANYGDLRATAADRTTGDLDSYYLNLFAHYQKNAWGHTLVVTGTTTDADLDRTVDYGAGAYKTNGSTDGYGIGALYELTYDVKLNDKGTSLLQPLFDASIVHTSLDGYTETGAGDAGLKVGKQDWTTASLAVGARWSGTFGTKTVGRTLFGELRTAVSQDFGDKQGKTAVALSGAPDFSQNVYGAKQGATAWQVSGGLSLPVSQQSSVYANAGAEFRNDANSVHGSFGVRYAF
jgi:outer membrane autotransporter protein